MKLIIGGRLIELKALDNSIDIAFKNLYAAFYANGALNLADLEAATFDFLNKAYSKIEQHDDYFNNFTILWNNFLTDGNYDKAESVWEMALDPVLKWEMRNKGKRIHKGTAYYFWGMTSLQRGEIDKGYTLMHRAVEEDVLTLGPQQAIEKPGFALVSLNYTKADQAFRQWVFEQASFLNVLQNKYSSIYMRQFILEDFRNRFLSNSSILEVLFLFAYTVAKLMNLTILPKHVSNNEFFGQLAGNIIFDLALVIDKAIQEKNPREWKFIDHASFLLNNAGSPLSKDKLAYINSEFKQDGDRTLRDILDGTFTLDDGTILTKLQSDVAVVYILRNHGAHDVSAISIVSEGFLDVQQVMMNVLFATVDYLY